MVSDARHITVSGTAWEIAIEVAHKRVDYGEILRDQPEILVPLKQAIFRAIRAALEERRLEGGRS